jgi:hypothetical protein
MRRGTVILAAALIALAGVGIAVGAYNAGEAHGVAQQIQTLETTATDGSDVVRVVGPGYGFGYGGWGHGGFFPFGFLLFPLFVIGVILLVRALVWRGGGWGPGRGWGPHDGPGGWEPGGPRDEWRSRAEAWHREMHESGESASRPDPEAPPSPTAAA